MESFFIQVVEGKLEIKLNKGVYLEDALKLREAFENYPHTYQDIHVEMGPVDYIDSTGLGVLISMKKKAEEYGGTVYLKNISETVSNLLELTRLNTIFNIK